MEGGREQCGSLSCALKALGTLTVENKNIQDSHAEGKTHFNSNSFQVSINNTKDHQSSHIVALLKLSLRPNYQVPVSWWSQFFIFSYSEWWRDLTLWGRWSLIYSGTYNHLTNSPSKWGQAEHCVQQEAHNLHGPSPAWLSERRRREQCADLVYLPHLEGRTSTLDLKGTSSLKRFWHGMAWQATGKVGVGEDKTSKLNTQLRPTSWNVRKSVYNVFTP